MAVKNVKKNNIPIATKKHFNFAFAEALFAILLYISY